MKQMIFLSAMFFALAFYSCKNQNDAIANKLVYRSWSADNKWTLWIYGNSEELPDGKAIIYDNKLDTGWITSRNENNLIFQNIFDKSIIKSVSCEEGTPDVPGNYNFIYDNNVVIDNQYKNILSFYIVDLQSESSKLYVFPDMKDYRIHGIGGGALALHNFAYKTDCLFFYEENRIEQIPKELKNPIWFPSQNKFLGLNSENKICFYDLHTKEIKPSKIKGMPYQYRPYFLTENFLYYAKFDIGYQIRVFLRYPYAILLPMAWMKEAKPEKWYRMNLETLKIERIKGLGTTIRILQAE